MSYDLTLQCGCVVYVSAHPATRLVHTRIIQSRGEQCRVRPHKVGARVYPWVPLPEPPDTAANRLRGAPPGHARRAARSGEHTSEIQSHVNIVCRLLLEKK